MTAGVEPALLRSDTGGTSTEVLRRSRDQRFGVIEFAVGVDVTPEFKGAAPRWVRMSGRTCSREVGRAFRS